MSAYKYNGSGNFISGIPARDLTSSEYDALTDEQKKQVVKSGLYTELKPQVEKEVKDVRQ